MKGRAVLAGLSVVAALGLAGCGDNGYEYVANKDAGLYFRVPDSWSVLEVDTEDTGRPAAVGDPVDAWTRLLDESPTPGAANFAAAAPAYPVGVASVEAVPDQQARDTLDYATLRGLAYGGTDPYEQSFAEDSNIQLVDLYDVTESDTVRGQRVIFTVHGEDGTYVTYDQTALVNNITTEIYRLLLKCESTCYERNRDEIDDIVDSWTIEQED
jgi:hypothetical protein